MRVAEKLHRHHIRHRMEVEEVDNREQAEVER